MAPPNQKPNRRTSIATLTPADLKLIPGYDPFDHDGSYQFDEETALRAVNFFPDCLQHVKGEAAGTPFNLEPWQVAIIANLFGWKRKSDGVRRYQEAFVFIPRKNGKSALAAGIILYVLYCDGEPGAELYSAAADAAQARMVFDQAKGMVLKSPALLKYCTVFKHSIEFKPTLSHYKPITSDADTKHGFNAHCVVCDELHAMRTRDLVDVLQTSTGARRQPLVVHTTTSDYDRPTICNEKYDYACKVRDKIFTDKLAQRFLPVIYEATRDDNWMDPTVWEKANPNLGVSKKREYMETENLRARATPSYENTHKRLDLNIRTEQATRWLRMTDWDACGGEIDLERLKGRPCYGGLDLSSTIDLTSLVFLFPEDKNTVLAFFWCPADRIQDRVERDRVPYDAWVRDGFITATPGNVVDYAFIRQTMLELAEQYDIREIGYDPYNARQFCVELLNDHGLPMFEFRQGYLSMNDPCKHLERLVISHELRHGGHPILRWNASNVVVTMDPNQNIKINKAKSTEKVDGMVSLAMTVGCALVRPSKKKSVYEERGALIL